MKIEQTNLNTIHLKFRQEKGDKNYGNCLWGDIIINCDDYTLTAKTDCGNYMYSWTPTPNDESFIHLLCRMEKESLVGKISSRKVFDFAESKKRTYEIIRGCRSIENAEQIIEDMELTLGDICKSEEKFYTVCSNILRDNNCSSEIIYIERGYPAEAEMFAEIFDTEIKPYLRTLEKQVEIKLKPCPFCGGEAKVYGKGYGYDHKGFVECTCGAQMVCQYDGNSNPIEKAVENWNRRKSE